MKDRRAPTVRVVRSARPGVAAFRAMCTCGWQEKPREVDIVAGADAELHSIFTGHRHETAAAFHLHREVA